jgi:hypothetical protein
MWREGLITVNCKLSTIHISPAILYELLRINLAHVYVINVSIYERLLSLVRIS